MPLRYDSGTMERDVKPGVNRMEITVWIVNWLCILIIFGGLVVLGKQIADIDRNGTEAGAKTMIELQHLRETVREMNNPESGGFAGIIKMIETKCK